MVNVLNNSYVDTIKLYEMQCDIFEYKLIRVEIEPQKYI